MGEFLSVPLTPLSWESWLWGSFLTILAGVLGPPESQRPQGKCWLRCLLGSEVLGFLITFGLKNFPDFSVFSGTHPLFFFKSCYNASVFIFFLMTVSWEDFFGVARILSCQIWSRLEFILFNLLFMFTDILWHSSSELEAGESQQLFVWSINKWVFMLLYK